MRKMRKKIASAILIASIVTSCIPNIGFSVFAANTETPAAKGLWLTEIYPNDVNRSAVYGNASDLMEFVEITNTSDAAISFNDQYVLNYEYPSGTAYVSKALTVTNGNGTSGVVIGAEKRWSSGRKGWILSVAQRSAIQSRHEYC